MYDELIKSLRVCASSGLPDSCLECPRFENGCDTLREDAADAIEHMQKTILRLENELGIYDDLSMVDQSMVLSKKEKTTKPHGRLIDADQLKEQLEYVASLEWNQRVGASPGIECAIDMLDDAQTIISAEEGET